MIKKSLKALARKFGLHLISDYDFQKRNMYLKVLERMLLSSKETCSSACSIIIFSKDRAMQLDALLRSMYHYSLNPPKVFVLYNSSNQLFDSAYQELISAHKHKEAHFIKEVNFNQDLKSLFLKVTTPKVLFLVDDLMFKNQVDFKRFSEVDTKLFVASLRMGNHLRFSYTLQREQKAPMFENNSEFQEMINWSYQQGELDWAYPLSVDGHLFDTQEMKVLVEELNYKAPNSFEEALQIMTPLFKKRTGVCFKESIIVNNPCNKVQVENNNIAGHISIEELNEKWLEGFRINFEEHKGLLNESAHQELGISFLKR